ncbi:MAG TPA: M23 family metallopeptidase, partial [Telluria sp.]|nr:M23 family metallopeptidase [Telluria sp.]
TFIIGALLGAAAMFFYLYQYPASPEVVAPPVVAPAPAPAAVPAPVAAPVQPAPAAAPVAQQPPGLANLLMPVEGIDQSKLADTFEQARGEAKHEAIDIAAPKGTKVFAVADGKLVKLFDSKEGGLTVYQFDPSQTYAYYYAHLDRYAEGLKEGMELKRGDLVGYVGNSGNADPATPHLHFTIFELTPEKQWWKGKAINPYPLLAPKPAQ